MKIILKFWKMAENNCRVDMDSEEDVPVINEVIRAFFDSGLSDVEIRIKIEFNLNL